MGNSECQGPVAEKNWKNAIFLLILQSCLLDSPPYHCDENTNKKVSVSKTNFSPLAVHACNAVKGLRALIFFLRCIYVLF